MDRIRTGLVAMVVACSACGGPKDPPQSEAEAPPAPPAEAMNDSTIPTQNGMRPGSMSAGAKATADSTALGAMRDSAFGPKFAVDSNGKVTRIKPPE